MRSACLIALVSTAAFGQNLGYRFLPPTSGANAVVFKQNVDTNYTALSSTQIGNALSGAAVMWNGASSCSWIQIGVAGTVSPPNDPTDQISVAPVWVQSSTDPNYSYAFGGNPQTVSASVPLTFAGQVYACDIYLNAYDYSFAVGGQPASMDLQSVLARELGHCIGLADTFVSTADVMYSIPKVGVQKRALTANDTNQICSYYPKHGYDAPCTGTGQGDCLSGQSLACVAFSGGPTACTIGCTYQSGGPNSCGQPLVCTANPPAGFTTSGYCAPTSGTSTPVGKACTGNANCPGPSAATTCFVQDIDGGLPSGGHQWPGGYCTQLDNGSVTCPTGAVPYPLYGSNHCLKICTLGGNECRNGYACSPLNGAALDAGEGTCVSKCYQDIDCGAGSVCRACDGVCLPINATPAARLGDSCFVDTDCGVGQNCLRPQGASGGVCSQPCANQCGSCPSGTDCLPAGVGGATYCMRDCIVGSCGPNLQCSPYGAGFGCGPKCGAGATCPSGYFCDSTGQCSAFGATDGGPCPLCFVAPTDSPPSASGIDAGINPVTGGGCGCQSTSGAALIPFALLVFALGARRRWPLH